MQALGINAGNLFVNICCFGIAFLVIVKFVVGPVQKMLDKRKAVIEQGLADAEAAAEARKNSEAVAEKILNEAKAEASGIIAAARQDAEKFMADANASADERLERERADLQAEIAAEREKMLADMRGQIIDISAECARKMVNDTLLGDDAKQHQLLSDLISGFAAGKNADLNQLPEAAAHLDVTTAVPLTADEKNKLEKIWSKFLRPGAAPIYRVDPQIIGGMVLRTESSALDLSIAAKATDIKKSME